MQCIITCHGTTSAFRAFILELGNQVGLLLRGKWHQLDFTNGCVLTLCGALPPRPPVRVSLTAVIFAGCYKLS